MTWLLGIGVTSPVDGKAVAVNSAGSVGIDDTYLLRLLQQGNLRQLPVNGSADGNVLVGVADNEIVYGNIGHDNIGYGNPVLWDCR
ncbi:hypothetical protein GCM10009765_43560 [Fodinicola feengrottensis]|uniref:Uncharacterized protein n=1 Tax=Fodinicola feengrottensis TaxID=435914 RepID=A0ABN2HLQ9_9ACTN